MGRLILLNLTKFSDPPSTYTSQNERRSAATRGSGLDLSCARRNRPPSFCQNAQEWHHSMQIDQQNRPRQRETDRRKRQQLPADGEHCSVSESRQEIRRPPGGNFPDR